MKAIYNEAVQQGLTELMARKGRLVPLPPEDYVSNFDPEDLRACSQIAGREIMKQVYREQFDQFTKMLNQHKLEIGKGMVAEGNTELGNRIINHEFSQDEMFDMMFAAMSPEEK